MRQEIYLASLTVICCVTGCAPTKPPPEVVVQPAQPQRGSATILSMRTVLRAAAPTPVQTVLLTGAVAGSDSADPSLVEFIVRTDDGATLSIVQTNESGLHAGDRVVIVRNGRAHLARPG